MPAAITMPLIIMATNMVATTRGATSRSSGSTPRTSMASISSRILRAPMSEQIAEPAAPAMISAAAIGRRLADGREHRGGAGEGLGAELAGEVADLERDDRAERDRDQDRRHQRDAGDEPGLLDELAELERAG